MKLSEIKSFNKRFLIEIFVIALLTLPAIWSLIRPGFFTMYDDMQVIRVQQMDVCVKDGQIPCRWVPELGYGYGYPIYQYYAPLPYYLMEGVHLLGISFIDSVKVGFALSVVFSALFMYLLAKKFFSSQASFAVVALYTLVPFRAASVYVRGAMGEAWGLATLPMVILGFENYLEKRDKTSLSLFGISIFLFLISHNLTVIMSAPVILGWMVFRIISNKKYKKSFSGILTGGFLGVTLAGFYLVPLIFEKGLVHIETLTQGYFYYVSHFLSLKQLVASIHWGYGPSTVGMIDDAFLGLGPVHVIIALVALIVLLFRKSKFDIKFGIFIFLSLLASLFLAHPRSAFIWENLTFMKYLQFPWRWIFISAFTSSFLGGYLFEKMKRFRLGAFLVLILLLLLVYGKFFTPKDWFPLNDNEKLSGELYNRQITASIYDYLPKSANELPQSRAPDYLVVNSGKVETNSVMRGSDWFRYKVFVGSNVANVTIPTYDFPKWVVKVDEENVPYERTPELGLLKFDINAGEHTIYAKLRKSTPRLLGDLLSLFGLILIGSILFTKKRKKYAKV